MSLFVLLEFQSSQRLVEGGNASTMGLFKEEEGIHKVEKNKSFAMQGMCKAYVISG